MIVQGELQNQRDQIGGLGELQNQRDQIGGLGGQKPEEEEMEMEKAKILSQEEIPLAQTGPSGPAYRRQD